ICFICFMFICFILAALEYKSYRLLFISWKAYLNNIHFPFGFAVSFYSFSKAVHSYMVFIFPKSVFKVFVFGSDGYLYQGRGWHWVGAHTRGYNSKGYGISFIGDYMKVLPDSYELELMKNNFIQCAVKGARLQANYTIHGHRQMVPTLCPGDRLFQEIETWKGFKTRCLIDKD
uniref:Peptidoglycan recognition protein family domain-containing protein n=1 Tax=Laticauda laticaudata TaxID=8630 RepID=A0A8C5RV50_LATLA